MSDFQAYAVGLAHASVCTSLTDEDATERLNWHHLTGTEHPWAISDDATFAKPEGTPNPCPCPDRPDTHRHILFVC